MQENAPVPAPRGTQRPVASPAARPLTVRHVLVVVAGILCLFGPAALAINTWSVFLVSVTESLGMTSGDFTFYVTLLFLSAAACSPLAGNLMQRADLRLVISGAAFLCALVLFSALSEASWDLLFATVLAIIAVVFATGMATIVLGKRINGIK